MIPENYECPDIRAISIEPDESLMAVAMTPSVGVEQMDGEGE